MIKAEFAPENAKTGASYPSPHDERCRGRKTWPLTKKYDLTQFGVNRVEVAPGSWSTQRHWHTTNDEVVIVISGELVLVTDEGEVVHTESIVSLPQANNRCVLPHFNRTPDDAFLRKIDASGKKWVIVTDPAGEPTFVLDSHQFLRDALFDQLETNPNNYWHRPIVVRDMKTRLGDIIGHMKVVPEHPEDDVIDNDLILVWGDQKRIITGADLLDRLLRGIVAVDGGGVAPQPGGRSTQSGAIAAGQAAPSMWSAS